MTVGESSKAGDETGREDFRVGEQIAVTWVHWGFCRLVNQLEWSTIN
jgi:hypothetical protein